MSIESQLEELKSKKLAPQWLQIEGYKTLTKGYLLENETPVDMYRRVARAAASYMKSNKEEWEEKFFQLIWKNWLCLATPVASNLGTTRALPISCFAFDVEDSIDGIFTKVKETALLSKHGGGTGSHMSNVRPRGAGINGGGFSNGVVSWIQNFRAAVNTVSQNGIRRGQQAVFLDVEHPDVEEFIDVRKHMDGIHLGVNVSEAFLGKCRAGEEKAIKIWKKILKARMENGEPYIIFIDKVNEANPQSYKDLGLEVKGSNLCTEIFLHTDPDHTFVCCLSSLNLARWDEWKNTETVFEATVFLDCVMEEFIQKARKITGFEPSVRFAEKSRALGLGVLGYHTYLQENMLAFESLGARLFNNIWSKHLKVESERASRWLAQELGEPEWCKGTGLRNTHRLAIAPTTSNALISGNLSQGIEPIVANTFTQKTAKGTFTRTNPTLLKLLDSIGKNIPEVLEQIDNDRGSVRNLNFLSDEQKEVFKTAFEINQREILFQANQRQRNLCQGQSLNLFFSADEEEQYIHEIHKEAAEMQFIKALYYVRSQSGIVAEKTNECKVCEA